ncbi:MAG: hypothetical protein KKI09_08250 [Spirochaetes bacterium]|nr:hypothetical protein [Spirochaetota bacterium]MBU0955402.1 hypothetical protein [Spirochaetota bacterium]
MSGTVRVLLCFLLANAAAGLALADEAAAGSVASGAVAATAASVSEDGLADPTEPLVLNPAKLLGASAAAIIASFGLPDHFRPVRGASADQDDIAFEYEKLDLVFYLWQDQVWQFRLGSGFSGQVAGLSWPAAAEALAEFFGRPIDRQDAWTEWHVPATIWPVRLRTVLAPSGSIEAAYVYRADF